MSSSNLSRPLPNISEQALQLRALLEQKRSPPPSADTSRSEQKPSAINTATTTVAPKVVHPITGRVSPRSTPSPNVTSPRGSIFFGGGGASLEKECEHDEDAVKSTPTDKGLLTEPAISGPLQTNLASTGIPVPRWHNTKPSVRKLKASSNEKKKQKAEENKQEPVDNHGIEEGALTIEDVPMNDEGNKSRRNSEEYKEISIKAQVLRAFLNPKKNKKDPIKREWLETDEPIVVQSGLSTLESDLPDTGLVVPEATNNTHEIAEELITAQKELEDAKAENVRIQSENENLIKERNELKLDLEGRIEIEEDRIKETEVLQNELSQITADVKNKEDRIEELEKDRLMAQENLETLKLQFEEEKLFQETEKVKLQNKMKEQSDLFHEEKLILEERASDLENQLQAAQALKDEEILSMEQKLVENEEKLNEVFTDLQNERNLKEKCAEDLKALSSELDLEIMKADSLEAEKNDLLKQLEDQSMTHQNQLQDQKESLMQDIKIQEGIAEIFQRENERLIKELHNCEQNSKTDLNKLKEKVKKIETEKSDQLQLINELEEKLQSKDDTLKSAEAESKKITGIFEKELDAKKEEIKTLQEKLSECEKKAAESLSLVQIHSSLQDNLEKSLQGMLNNLNDSIRGEIGETVSQQLVETLSKENELLRRNAEKGRVMFDEARYSTAKPGSNPDELALSREKQEMMELNQQYQMQLQNCATLLKIIRKTVLQW